MSEYVLCAWSIRFVLCSDTKRLKAKHQTKTKLLYAPGKGERELGNRSFVLYRLEMERFLQFPKPLEDQVSIELSTLMAFRSEEVCTFTAECVFFDQAECLVLDCKKHKLLPVPLHRVVAKHVELLLDGRTEGYVIPNTSSSCRSRGDKPISTTANWMKWHRNAEKANMFPTPYDYSPLVGRQWFICYWLNYLRLGVVPCSMIVRHDNPYTTWLYGQRLNFWEDVVGEFAKFEEATTPHIQDFKQMEMKVKA